MLVVMDPQGCRVEGVSLCNHPHTMRVVDRYPSQWPDPHGMRIMLEK